MTESARRALDAALMVLALALGLAIAWFDSRPHWDDAGITAGMLLIGSAALALGVRRRAWMIALAVGIWIPLQMIAHASSVKSALMPLLILLFPMIGAYAGMGMRRLVART
jgi:hypothetical protein